MSKVIEQLGSKQVAPGRGIGCIFESVRICQFEWRLSAGVSVVRRFLIPEKSP